ncbi:MAG: pro-sigmaK processing inhibitor BofA family protein [Oscillospiraceae bacterium]|nr:pro-sigmaK processing inhibitor BofA family protein [Oscillospiraceae bacterium]
MLRPTALLLRLAAGSLAGLVLLVLAARFGPSVGLAVPVSWPAVLTVGLLGLPGFALVLVLSLWF